MDPAKAVLMFASAVVSITARATVGLRVGNSIYPSIQIYLGHLIRSITSLPTIIPCTIYRFQTHASLSSIYPFPYIKIAICLTPVYNKTFLNAGATQYGFLGLYFGSLP